MRISEVDFGGARIRAAVRVASRASRCRSWTATRCWMRPVAADHHGGRGALGRLRHAATSAPGRTGCGLSPGGSRTSSRCATPRGLDERRSPPGPPYSVTPGRAGSATVRVSSARRRLVPRQRTGVRPAVAGPASTGATSGHRSSSTGTRPAGGSTCPARRTSRRSGTALSGSPTPACSLSGARRCSAASRCSMLRAPPRPLAGLRRTPAAPVPAEPGGGRPVLGGRALARRGRRRRLVPTTRPADLRDRGPRRRAGPGQLAGRGHGVGAGGRGPPAAGVAAMGPQGRAWAAGVAAAGVLGGTLLAAAAAVLAGWHLVRPPAPRTLLRRRGGAARGGAGRLAGVRAEPRPGPVRAGGRRQPLAAPAGRAGAAAARGRPGSGADRREEPVTVTVGRARPATRCAPGAPACESVRAQDLPVELSWSTTPAPTARTSWPGELADTAVRGGPERSAQRNSGVGLAGGEWVLWVDSDMVLPPTTVLGRARRPPSAPAPARSPCRRSASAPASGRRCRALERSCYLDDPGLHNPRLLRRDCCSATARSTRRWPARRTPTCGCRLHAAGTLVALCRGRAHRARRGPADAALRAGEAGLLRPQPAGVRGEEPGRSPTRAPEPSRALLPAPAPACSASPAHAAGLLLLRAAEAGAYAVGYGRAGGRRRAA